MSKKSDAALYDEVLEAVRAAGEASDSGGGTLEIGTAPDRGPSAPLHVLYPAIGDEEIEEGEERLGRAIPGPYAELLKKANGLDAFAESFQLYGIRSHGGRGGQPSSLLNPNVRERPDGATDEMFFFAFYDWDGSLLYLDEGDGKVHRTERDAVEPLNEWDSIADAIHSEFFRLAELFEDGFDEDKKTVPE